MSVDDVETEKRAIREAILAYYHEGHVRNDPNLYREILHPEWKFFLLDKENNLVVIDRDQYLARYDPINADPALHWETEFYKIDISGRIGAVKLRLECEKVKYIDYLHMMKIGGKWWIVHKMSDYHDKQ